MKPKPPIKTKPYHWLWLSSALFLIAVQSVWATDQGVNSVRQRVGACLECHGNEEYSRERFGYAAPKLGGQNAQYIIKALVFYKNESRPDNDIHRDNAHKMSATEIAAVAEFFSELTASDSSPVVADYAGAPGVAYDKNKEAYDRKKVVCASCHSKDGDQPTQSDWPILAGQHRDYIVHVLNAYRSGQRQDAIMTIQIELLDLTDEDIQKMAYHYSVRRHLTDAGSN